MYYPILMRVGGARVLVVGGGAVAWQKVRALTQAGAEVHVVAPEVQPRIARRRGVVVHREPFAAGHLRGAVLAVAATDDPAVNRRVFEAARRRGIPVNVVDVPDLCTFIVPAIVRRGPVLVAISTSGGSPAFSKSMRREMERHIPPALGRLVRAIDRHRRRIARRIRDAAARARALKKIGGPFVLRLFREKGLAAAGDYVRRLAESLGGRP